MKLFLLLPLLFVSLFADDDLDPSDLAPDENIHPSEFTVKLIKNCEVLALSVEPDRKAKKIYTNIWTNGCVQNLGCIREVTQKELDALPENEKRFYGMEIPCMV